MDTVVCHPDDISFHHMSSGWLSRNWYLIRMRYDNVIMSSGWDTLPFLSHPGEIANFAFRTPRWPFSASVIFFWNAIYNVREWVSPLLTTYQTPSSNQWNKYGIIIWTLWLPHYLIKYWHPFTKLPVVDQAPGHATKRRQLKSFLGGTGLN